jgi:hypothetical protein
MNSDLWIDQLYSDESLTDHITREDAERLRSWSESYMAGCDTEVEASRLMDAIRLLNRYVKEGEPFDDLFAALRANFMRTVSDASSIHPDAADVALENLYPDDTASGD